MDSNIEHVAVSSCQFEVRLLEGLGWWVWNFPKNISTKKSFFDAVRNGPIDLDPPLTNHNSWDALEDSLGAALLSLGEPGVLIIWCNYKSFEVGENASDFEIAMQILESLAGGTGRLKVLMVG